MKRKTDSIKQLTIFYSVALITIVLLSSAGQAIIQYALNQEITTRNTASVIGKQRGLVSVMIIDMEVMLTFPEKRQSALSDLRTQTAQWEVVQDAAYHGSAKLNVPATLEPDIRAHVSASRDDYNVMRSAISQLFTRNMQALALNAALRTFLDRGPGYQLTMLYVFNRMNTEADAEIEQIQKIEILLYSATVLVVILEYVFVFRQATRQLRTQFELLHREQVAE